MRVLGALSTAVTRLRQNPVIVVGAFLLTILSGLLVVPSFVDPTLGNLVWIPWMLVWPFLIAGFLGMIVDASAGGTTLGAFIDRGQSRYQSMLGATVVFALLLTGVMIVTVIVSMIVMIVAVGAIAIGDVFDGNGSLLLIVALVLVVLLLLVPYFLVYLFVQFYDVAVVHGERAISSLQHSVALVKSNRWSVIGYTLVFVGIQSVGYGPGYAILFLGGLEITATGEWIVVSESLVAIGALLTTVLGSLAMALAFTYHVTFYESLTRVADESRTINGR